MGREDLEFGSLNLKMPDITPMNAHEMLNRRMIVRTKKI